MTSPVTPRERPVFFPCGDESRAGILTVPAQPNGRTVLIPWGAGVYPSSGRNRVRTRLARALADQGFHAFRFDYRGVGESEGEYRKPNMASPATADILAACEWLRSQGLTRLVVAAHCFGGWSALMAASQITGLEGMAVISAPVRRDHREMRTSQRSWRWWATRLKGLTLAKLRRSQNRAAYLKLARNQVSTFVRSRSRSSIGLGSSPQPERRFAPAVDCLLDHGIPVFLLYGEDDFRGDLEAELDSGLRTALEQAGDPTLLVTLPEKLGLASLAAQDIVVDNVVKWVTGIPDTTQAFPRSS